ncbi:MAG: molybdenum cofactor guanylyltransferase [Robiginitomaculum sp.]|nr:MAG: molybdenum cofactor guanylyltransferase [Robiginitomaculum sp.]
MPCAVMIEPIGLVLAGGQSRRMGRDKAALMIGGMSLLDRAKALLAEAGCNPILVSGAGGLVDRFANAGPLAGLDAALHTLSDGQWVLVIPVDMPNLKPALLKKLIQARTDEAGLYFADHPMPVCVRVTSDLRAYLQQTLEAPDGDRSLFCLFRSLGFTAIAGPGRHSPAFWNCNTPEQLANLELSS